MTQFPWQCTLAEGGYSIQNCSLLCEGDKSGEGVGSLNPEDLHLISSAKKHADHSGLCMETQSGVERRSMTTDITLFGVLKMIVDENIFFSLHSQRAEEPVQNQVHN